MLSSTTSSRLSNNIGHLSSEEVSDGTVTLRSRDGRGIGIDIDGNCRDGFVVQNVQPDSAAGATGKIKPGDRISGISVELESLGLDDIQNILAILSPYPVKLQVRAEVPILHFSSEISAGVQKREVVMRSPVRSDVGLSLAVPEVGNRESEICSPDQPTAQTKSGKKKKSGKGDHEGWFDKHKPKISLGGKSGRYSFVDANSSELSLDIDAVGRDKTSEKGQVETIVYSPNTDVPIQSSIGQLQADINHQLETDGRPINAEIKKSKTSKSKGEKTLQGGVNISGSALMSPVCQAAVNVNAEERHNEARDKIAPSSSMGQVEIAEPSVARCTAGEHGDVLELPAVHASQEIIAPSIIDIPDAKASKNGAKSKKAQGKKSKIKACYAEGNDSDIELSSSSARESINSNAESLNNPGDEKAKHKGGFHLPKFGFHAKESKDEVPKTNVQVQHASAPQEETMVTENDYLNWTDHIQNERVKSESLESDTGNFELGNPATLHDVQTSIAESRANLELNPVVTGAQISSSSIDLDASSVDEKTKKGFGGKMKDLLGGSAKKKSKAKNNTDVQVGGNLSVEAATVAGGINSDINLSNFESKGEFHAPKPGEHFKEHNNDLDVLDSDADPHGVELSGEVFLPRAQVNLSAERDERALLSDDKLPSSDPNANISKPVKRAKKSKALKQEINDSEQHRPCVDDTVVFNVSEDKLLANAGNGFSSDDTPITGGTDVEFSSDFHGESSSVDIRHADVAPVVHLVPAVLHGERKDDFTF